VKLRLVDRDAFPAFGKIFSVRKKFSGRLVSIFSRIKKSSGGDDSQQDSAERVSTNSHEPLQHNWRRSSDTGAAVSKRCRAALRRLAVGVWTAVQVGSIFRRAALR
jgi:hypothetical protein